MNTLVIHPQDQTTDFLSVIYKDTNWNVINNNSSKKYLKEQIKLLYEGNTSVVNFNKNNLFCKL
jgi:hypothetical protein